MDPQNQNPGSYLDQIAPVQQKNALFTGKMGQLILIGVIAVIVVIIMSIVAGSIGGGKKDEWMKLSLHIKATEEIASDASAKIKNNRLRSINSEISIFLTNLNRDITPMLASQNITAKSIPESLSGKINSSKTLATLEDARLNDVYDRTYSREMTFQVAQLLLTLENVYKSSSNKDTKQKIETAYASLKTNHETLSSYNESVD